MSNDETEVIVLVRIISLEENKNNTKILIKKKKKVVNNICHLEFRIAVPYRYR